MTGTRGIACVAWLLLSVAACGGDPDAGPGRVVWDRDTCEQCSMAISDRSFAVQVRVDGRLHRFDDPGCAVLWLKDRGPAEPDEVWVGALDAEGWLDARKARFVEAAHTPMGYGYGARAAGPETGIDFEALRVAIAQREDERRKHADH